MKITLNTTWDDVTREIRSDGTTEQRALCDLASAEVDELEATVDEFQSFVDASKWDTIQDALHEQQFLSEFVRLHEFLDDENFVEQFNAMKFELDFIRLFFKCQ
tara:strand:- start:2197 stop:2508 length:312 start_codon:yes stop_codon:yes gene_type:complete